MRRTLRSKTPAILQTNLLPSGLDAEQPGICLLASLLPGLRGVFSTLP